MAALLLALVAALVTAAALLRIDWRTPYAHFPAEGVFVEIPHGMTAAAIGRTLEAQGVVRSAVSFRALALWRAHGRPRLQAGEYRFEHAETPEQVFDTIEHGRIYQVTVIVPEGENMFAIAAELEAKEVTKSDAFITAARNPHLIADLAPNAPSLEGFLFPATYQFPRHQAAVKVAEAMVHRFREAWTGITASQAGGTAGLGPLGIVTLASLVEKETGVPEERAKVASVFANRLRMGIALDCDPTVIYALVLDGRYSGRLLLPDLQVDSPYNTYRRRGLPPGPIANPGEASLRAAMAPVAGKLLYFVATGDGGHVFSETLAEHNRNVANYRKHEAEVARDARTRQAGKPPS